MQRNELLRKIRRTLGPTRILAAVALISLLVSGCSMHSRRAAAGRPGFEERGLASWYGPGFHGKQTSNGEVFDMNGLTAAHKQLPFDTIVEVRNRENGRTVRVRINDRGPFVRGRIIDLSRGAAEALGLLTTGVAEVSLRVVSAPAPDAEREGGGWIVQAGAFRDRTHAEHHLQRVEQLERRAHIESGSGMHRVVIGPVKSRRDAGRIAADLERHGISAFVRKVG
jgi:rare lipoprotein A